MQEPPRTAPPAKGGGALPEASPPRRVYVAKDRTPRVVIETVSGLGGGVAGAMLGALLGSGITLGNPAGPAAGAIGGGTLGLSLGVWFAGWANDGDGQYVWTLIGTAAGAMGLATTAYLANYLGTTGYPQLAIALIFAGFTMPMVGGLLGYELTSPLSRTQARAAAEAMVWMTPIPGGAAGGVRGTFF